MVRETDSSDDRETLAGMLRTDPISGGVPDPFPGEYRLLRRLGRGQFGDVWLADDLSPLRRPVALKFLRVDGKHGNGDTALEVLRNEARILGGLRHPNIVQVFAWRETGRPPAPCLILQYVPGGSLEDQVKARGRLAWQVGARYIADVAEGLRLLHGRGIIHRDVKPANLLLDTEADEALLTDFGIAACLSDPATAAGTPLFMAPEGHRGEISPALDVFGLAASLFWLVVGEAPFDGGSREELRAAMEAGLPAIEPRFAAMPKELEQLVRECLVARPSERPDLESFCDRLRGALNLCLADALAAGETVAVPLRLLVWRQVQGGEGELIADNQQESDDVRRDESCVPARPRQVTLRSGERVRLEVITEESGYVVVFNVGPTGNLNLLYPDKPGRVSPRIEAGEPVPILDVELTPPTGRERIIAVWTRQPIPMRLEELRSLVEPEGAYCASRDMVRVQQSLERIGGADRRVVVLEIDHR